ncbi:SIMPL domain-containing protein [Brevundimonas sp.]|uniref:SIMPL domain-containing protein n=1 Tax=Brevundimonas sp. TaxID=1871086 RepID=UPI001DC0990F|nr:SIMPL domain-containing protein [Brevundimonas sp.]MBL0946878.1 SIMPL domain-containing protein [Brevundimonas sp.]
MIRSPLRLLMPMAAAVALAGVSAPALAQSMPEPAGHHMVAPPYLSLAAYGEVKVAPDMATINFGVMTEAATAEAAMRQNAQYMERVMAALRRAGIAERDIQTSGLNLSAQYDYLPNQPPRLRGYQAVNRVTVTVRDLSRVGTTADAVVSAGVNQIDGISFGLTDRTAAEDQARRLAVRDLQRKASLYAEALGVRLGGIRGLSEGTSMSAPPPMPYARAEMMVQSDAATSVSPGELTVRVDITGVYDLIR